MEDEEQQQGVIRKLFASPNHYYNVYKSNRKTMSMTKTQTLN